ncbi:hypothetical protein GCM10027612_63690 [Microbispora bryophytorum subsp. camponoti]
MDRSRSPADVAAEHEPILAAVLGRDPDAAAAAMRGHAAHTGELLVAQAAAENGGRPAPPASPSSATQPANLQRKGPIGAGLVARCVHRLVTVTEDEIRAAQSDRRVWSWAVRHRAWGVGRGA